MKKIFLLLPLALLLMSLQCESRIFEQVSTININEVYEINEAAPFSESHSISRDQILDMLDVPENATIKKVNIESMSARVVILDGNQADALSLSGRLQLGSTSPALFNNFPVPLVAVDAPWLGLNNLIAEGVSGLRNKIENFLIGSETGSLSINVSGDSAPTGGELLKAQIHLRITGTVGWNICEPVPFFIEAGESCEIAM